MLNAPGAIMRTDAFAGSARIVLLLKVKVPPLISSTLTLAFNVTVPEIVMLVDTITVSALQATRVAWLVAVHVVALTCVREMSEIARMLNTTLPKRVKFEFMDLDLMEVVLVRTGKLGAAAR